MHGYCMVKILPHQYSGRCWTTNVSNQRLPLGAGMIVSDSTDAFFFRLSVFQVFSSQQWHTQELLGKDGKAEGDSAVARRFHYSGTLAGSLGHVERGADPSLFMPCRKLVDRGGSIAWEGQTLDSNCIVIGPWFIFFGPLQVADSVEQTRQVKPFKNPWNKSDVCSYSESYSSQKKRVVDFSEQGIWVEQEGFTDWFVSTGNIWKPGVFPMFSTQI